jgi:hypothetical protein
MNGQRAQQHGVYQAEDGRIGADAKGEGDDRGSSERRLLAQHSRRIANVLPCVGEQTALWNASGNRLGGVREGELLKPLSKCLVVELLERLTARRRLVGAVTAQLRAPLVEMDGEFLDDLDLARRAQGQTLQPLAKFLLPLRHVLLR